MKEKYVGERRGTRALAGKSKTKNRTRTLEEKENGRGEETAETRRVHLVYEYDGVKENIQEWEKEGGGGLM